MVAVLGVDSDNDDNNARPYTSDWLGWFCMRDSCAGYPFITSGVPPRRLGLIGAVRFLSLVRQVRIITLNMHIVYVLTCVWMSVWIMWIVLGSVTGEQWTKKKLRNPNRELNCKSKVIHPQTNQKMHCGTSLSLLGHKESLSRRPVWSTNTIVSIKRRFVVQLLTNIINQRAHASAATLAESGRVFWRGHKHNACAFFVVAFRCCCRLALCFFVCGYAHVLYAHRAHCTFCEHVRIICTYLVAI